MRIKRQENRSARRKLGISLLPSRERCIESRDEVFPSKAQHLGAIGVLRRRPDHDDVAEIRKGHPSGLRANPTFRSSEVRTATRKAFGPLEMRKRAPGTTPAPPMSSTL